MRSSSHPVELAPEQVAAVAGGLNPQPLPPVESVVLSEAGPGPQPWLELGPQPDPWLVALEGLAKPGF